MTPQRGPDWKRLGRYVRARREELDMLQDEFSVRYGVSTSTLQAIEMAKQPGYRRETLQKLEVGLRWAPGSVKAILAGGEPTLVEDDGGVDEDRVDRILSGIDVLSGTVSALAAGHATLADQQRQLADEVSALGARVTKLEGPARQRRR